jgi:hypothetical protein
MDSTAAAVRSQEEPETVLEPARVSKPSGLLANVTKKINEIEKLLQNEKNLEAVEEKFRELQERVTCLTAAYHQEINRNDIRPDQKRSLDDWYEEKFVPIDKSTKKIKK